MSGRVTAACASLAALTLAAGCASRADDSKGSSSSPQIQIPKAAPAPLPALSSGSLSPSQAPHPATLTKFTQQKLTWKACPGHTGFDCTSVTVPVDYAAPSGATMQIAVNRLKATGPGSRIGSLLTNPGGPGGSGLDYVYDGRDGLKNLNARYDIIGFDPRGVGASEGVTCLSGKDLDAYYQNDFNPSTTAQAAKTLAASKAYAQACDANSGKILPFVGTENVVRDMDVIRAALGDAKLSYFGISYGTRLGLVYAGMYPTSVARMVLDSVDNPDATDGPEEEQNGDDAEVSLGRVWQLCAQAEGAKCPVGADPVAAGKRFDALLAKLTAKPVTAGGRTLTASLARLAAFQATYDPFQIGPVLADGIVGAEQGDPSKLLSLADLYLSRGENGSYSSSAASFLAVKSLEGDPTAPRPSDAEVGEQLQSVAAAAAKKSPHFGALLVYLNTVSAYWPVPPTAVPAAVKAAGTPPILLVNDTVDNATPLKDAQQVEQQLANAVLVTNEADGHGAYGRGACITKTVDDYLDSGKVPAKGTTCQGT